MVPKLLEESRQESRASSTRPRVLQASRHQRKANGVHLKVDTLEKSDQALHASTHVVRSGVRHLHVLPSQPTPRHQNKSRSAEARRYYRRKMERLRHEGGRALFLERQRKDKNKKAYLKRVARLPIEEQQAKKERQKSYYRRKVERLREEGGLELFFEKRRVYKEAHLKRVAALPIEEQEARKEYRRQYFREYRQRRLANEKDDGRRRYRWFKSTEDKKRKERKNALARRRYQLKKQLQWLTLQRVAPRQPMPTLECFSKKSCLHPFLWYPRLAILASISPSIGSSGKE